MSSCGDTQSIIIIQIMVCSATVECDFYATDMGANCCLLGGSDSCPPQGNYVSRSLYIFYIIRILFLLCHLCGENSSPARRNNYYATVVIVILFTH